MVREGAQLDRLSVSSPGQCGADGRIRQELGPRVPACAGILLAVEVQGLQHHAAGSEEFGPRGRQFERQFNSGGGGRSGGDLRSYEYQ